MPIYAIKNNDTGQLRLVEAKRPISAVNHVVGTMFTVAEADARDGVELGRQGGTVEVAGEVSPDPDSIPNTAVERFQISGEDARRLMGLPPKDQSVIPDAESDEAE